VWDVAGAVTALDTLPGGTYSGGSDINNHGTIVGVGRTADGAFHGVRW
jgi:uncharacterized membrane protein